MQAMKMPEKNTAQKLARRNSNPSSGERRRAWDFSVLKMNSIFTQQPMQPEMAMPALFHHRPPLHLT